MMMMMMTKTRSEPRNLDDHNLLPPSQDVKPAKKVKDKKEEEEKRRCSPPQERAGPSADWRRFTSTHAPDVCGDQVVLPAAQGSRLRSSLRTATRQRQVLLRRYVQNTPLSRQEKIKKETKESSLVSISSFSLEVREKDDNL